jgi:hypothetical protein
MVRWNSVVMVSFEGSGTPLELPAYSLSSPR